MAKTKRYKDGNPDVFREFNDITWKNMTEPERAMWTKFSEVERAPIPKEVIEFEKRFDEPDEEKEKIKEQLDDLGIRYSHNSKLETLRKKLSDATDSE